MKLTIKRVLLLIGLVIVGLYILRDVYPISLLTHPVIAFITPLTDQASHIGTDLYTSIRENMGGLGPILAIGAPLGGLAIKGVVSRIQNLKNTAGTEIVGLKGTVNQLFSQKAQVEQQVASMTGQVAGLTQQKDELHVAVNQLKGELLELRSHESDLMDQKKQWQTEKLTLTRIIEQLKPQEEKTYVQ